MKETIIIKLIYQNDDAWAAAVPGIPPFCLNREDAIVVKSRLSILWAVEGTVWAAWVQVSRASLSQRACSEQTYLFQPQPALSQTIRNPCDGEVYTSRNAAWIRAYDVSCVRCWWYLHESSRLALKALSYWDFCCCIHRYGLCSSPLSWGGGEVVDSTNWFQGSLPLNISWVSSILHRWDSGSS